MTNLPEPVSWQQQLNGHIADQQNMQKFASSLFLILSTTSIGFSVSLLLAMGVWMSSGFPPNMRILDIGLFRVVPLATLSGLIVGIVLSVTKHLAKGTDE